MLSYTLRPISDRTAFTGPPPSSSGSGSGSGSGRGRGNRNPFEASWSANVRAIALGLEAACTPLERTAWFRRQRARVRSALAGAADEDCS